MVAALLLQLATAHLHRHWEGLLDVTSKGKLGGLHKDGIGGRLQGTGGSTVASLQGNTATTLAPKQLHAFCIVFGVPTMT